MPKGTFDRIPAPKRERVLREAARLFAERGYAGADMDELARRAGVSKGSLYTYFDGKEELYLVVCRDGLARFRRAVYGAIDRAWDTPRQLDHVFRAGAAFAADHPEYVRLYLNVSSAGMEHFADELSAEVEGYAAAYLTGVLRAGIEAGTVRTDLDVPMAACFVNDHYILLLAARVARHFRIRAAQYLGLPDDDAGAAEQLDRTIRLIHDFLRPPQGDRREDP